MSKPVCSYCGEPFVTLMQPCMNPDCPTRQPVGAGESAQPAPAPAPDPRWLLTAPVHQIIGSHVAVTALQSLLRERETDLASARAAVRGTMARCTELGKGLPRGQRVEMWAAVRASAFDQLVELLHLNERGSAPTTGE